MTISEESVQYMPVIFCWRQGLLLPVFRHGGNGAVGVFLDAYVFFILLVRFFFQIIIAHIIMCVHSCTFC